MKVGTILNIKKKDKLCTAVVKLYDFCDIFDIT